MRLLVTGASGQLGTDLVGLARSRGLDVTGLTRADLDLGRVDTVVDALAGRDYDTLVNCAAYNDTSGAESEPAKAFAVNARAPEALATAARAAGARFVHISTDYVFDGRSRRPYAEEDPPAPLGVYGASKLTGEALARRAHPEGTRVVRTAALFGVAAAARGGGNFIETILSAARSSAAGSGPLRGVHDITVSPTATADLAGGLLDLIETDAPAGLYHLVNEGQATWCELACAIVERAGLDVPVEPVSADDFPSAFRRPTFSVLDSGRAAALIGALPHWEEALDRYLAERASSANTP